MATTAPSTNTKPRRLTAAERERLVAEARRPGLTTAELNELASRYGVRLRWVQELLRQAGAARPPYPAPVPDASERARISRLYLAGESISAISRATGRAHKTVRLVLAELGLRTSGSPTNPNA